MTIGGWTCEGEGRVEGGAPTSSLWDGGLSQTLCPPHLISNRDSFKSNDQLARELQRRYLMSFSSFSKTLI